MGHVQLRGGMTLLEVSIAVTLFATLMVGVMQASISTTTYATVESTNTSVEVASVFLRNQIINDFANSAIFLAYDPVTMADTETQLYPAFTGTSSVEFLKVRSSPTIAASPAQEHALHLNLAAAVPTNNAQNSIAMSDYFNAPPVPFLIYNSAYASDPSMFVAPVWESSRSGLTFAQNRDPSYLRHYRYIVLTNATTGLSNLLRQYSQGATSAATQWTLDAVLAENVSNFSVSQSATNAKQILISLDITGVSALDPSLQAKRHIDITAAMRSLSL